ncbi:hypothetical protein HK099_002868 [Clydaea vesicula]|uniref:Uncharacterized protein n=1 Tax=Clydaea vesicula TaxID=447962 RepID=A0AAD5UBT5_9FUNG|nr:hypothetical protein HK099_002868 [Clydaea vesicula]
MDPPPLGGPPPPSRWNIAANICDGMILGSCFSLIVFLLIKLRFTKFSIVQLIGLVAYIISSSAYTTLNGLPEDFKLYNIAIASISNAFGRAMQSEIMTQFYITLTNGVSSEKRKMIFAGIGRLMWVLVMLAGIAEGTVFMIFGPGIALHNQVVVVAVTYISLLCGLVNAAQFLDMILVMTDAHGRLMESLKNKNFLQLFVLSIIVLGSEILAAVISAVAISAASNNRTDPTISIFFSKLTIITSCVGLVLLQESIVKYVKARSEAITKSQTSRVKSSTVKSSTSP